MGSRGILWCWAAWWAAAEATSCVFVDNVLDHAAEGRIVVAADMDDDGNVDVITSNDGAFTVFYGDGNGGFTAVTYSMGLDPSSPPDPTQPDAGSGALTGLVVDHVDGDGVLDVVAVSTDDWVAYWSSTDDAPRTKTYVQVVDSTPIDPSCVATLDADNDGDADIAHALYQPGDTSDQESVGVNQNIGNGLEWMASTWGETFEGVASLVSADFDSDGDEDLVGANLAGDSLIAIENLSGGSTAVEHTFASDLERPNCVFAVDVDEDSDMDALIAVQGDEEVYWFENFYASDDGFASHAIDVASVAPRSVFGVDMDGDGDVDVLASSYEDDTVAWYENDGSESFAKRIVSTSPWGRGLVTGVSVGYTGGCVSMVEFSRRDGTTQRSGADAPDASNTVDPPIDPNSEYVSYIGQYVRNVGQSLCRTLRGALKEAWGWDVDDQVFAGNVTLIVREQVAIAQRYDEDLDLVRGKTREETVALRAARLYELERVAHFTTVERLIHDNAVSQNADDDEAARVRPSLAAYGAAWVATLAVVGGAAYYLAAFGSVVGTRQTRKWLLDLVYTFVLFYFVIESLFILNFSVLLPGLLKEHYEKFHDPTALKRYPFKAPLPTISSFLLALWRQDELGDTQVGKHCLGTSATILQTADLAAILEDASWKPSLPFRVSIYLASFLVVLPRELQQALFEEMVLFFWVCVASLAFVVPAFDTDGGAEIVAIVRLVVLVALAFAAVYALGALYNAVLNAFERVVDGETRQDFENRADPASSLADVSFTQNPLSSRRGPPKQPDIEMAPVSSGPRDAARGPGDLATLRDQSRKASRASADAIALRLGVIRHKVRNSTLGRRI